MIRYLLPLLLLATVTCACADGIPVPHPALVGSLDGGPTLGAAASWEVYEVWDLPLCLDIGVKRADGGTDWFAGGSTHAMGLLDKLPLLRLAVPLLDRVFPDDTFVGVGYLFDSGEPWVYLSTRID